jgi:hypothetical protein
LETPADLKVHAAFLPQSDPSQNHGADSGWSRHIE